MKNKAITILLTLGLATIINSTNALAESAPTLHSEPQQIHFQHIRNATSKLTYGDTTFLIDPMLAKKDTYPGFAGTYRSEYRPCDAGQSPLLCRFHLRSQPTQ